MPGPSGKTTRRGLPFPVLGDTPDAEADVKALAEALDQFAKFNQGTLAARPATGASQEGDIYWAKDDTTYGPTGSWWILFGAKWELFPLPNVSTAMLVNLAVTTAKLAEEGVTTAKIAALAITTPKIAAGAVTLEKLGANVLPAGLGPIPYGGTAAPEGWLLCEGQAVSRTGATAALFAALGTAYGAGDGSTTFNVPDMRGRTPIGRDNMGGGAGAAGRVLTKGARAESGGNETHALTEGEMPSHNHGITDPGHNHAERIGSRFLIANTGSDGTDAPKVPGGGTESSLETATKVTGISLAAKGGSAAHNIMQPYQVHTYIIKT
jgi:microcystin-dependent protein